MGGRPARMGGRPARIGGRPAPIGGRPAPIGGRPAPIGGRPAPVGGRPDPIGARPARIGGRPARIGGRPARIGGRPARMGGRPARMGGRPARMGGARLFRTGPPPCAHTLRDDDCDRGVDAKGGGGGAGTAVAAHEPSRRIGDRVRRRSHRHLHWPSRNRILSFRVLFTLPSRLYTLFAVSSQRPHGHKTASSQPLPSSGRWESAIVQSLPERSHFLSPFECSDLLSAIIQLCLTGLPGIPNLDEHSGSEEQPAPAKTVADFGLLRTVCDFPTVLLTETPNAAGGKARGPAARAPLCRLCRRGAAARVLR
eukprot:gene13054-biopygen12936